MALGLIMVGQHTGRWLCWGSRKDRRADAGAGYGPLVPVEFLSDEQAEAYGTFAEEPTRPELKQFFFLDDVDRDLIARRRSAHHQLGFALQMCTVRYIGRFLPDDPLDAPWPVVEHLAARGHLRSVRALRTGRHACRPVGGRLPACRPSGRHDAGVGRPCVSDLVVSGVPRHARPNTTAIAPGPGGNPPEASSYSIG
nr:DUF4158 domain-containing protein [Streptomyces sp. SID4923]